VCTPGPDILLDDEPRFAGGAEIPLTYAHLALVFDNALGAYWLSCDDEDGEAVRLILEPAELERIALEFLASRAEPPGAVPGAEPGSR
jgi:hypothetical protein